MTLIAPNVKETPEWFPARLIQDIEFRARGIVIKAGTEFSAQKECGKLGYAWCCGLPISQVWMSEFEYLPTPTAAIIFFD